jgi:hypothetical protein
MQVDDLRARGLDPYAQAPAAKKALAKAIATGAAAAPTRS